MQIWLLVREVKYENWFAWNIFLDHDKEMENFYRGSVSVRVRVFTLARACARAVYHSRIHRHEFRTRYTSLEGTAA